MTALATRHQAPEGAWSSARARVAVLLGGTSPEREVSRSSGSEVLSALEARGSDGRGPLTVEGVEIEAAGRWRIGERSLGALAALAELAPRVDVFFLALHGGEGEDGTLQGLLEGLGLCHTGSGVRASALCMDKWATRALAVASGVRVAPGELILSAEWRANRGRALERARRTGSDGWAVKPRCGGSSVATWVLEPDGDLAAAIDGVLATGDDCLVEARIRGVECSCGVLGNRGEALRALPPVEIEPASGRFFDYQQKYAADGALEHCPPVHIDALACERVQRAALDVYAAAGCDGYARIDFFAAPDGLPTLLEVNTLPGITPRSLLPQEARAIGLGYRDLCLEIVEAALRRRVAGARPGA